MLTQKKVFKQKEINMKFGQAQVELYTYIIILNLILFQN